MEKRFTVEVKGVNDIIYEDKSCIAQVGAADFRDKWWWVGIVKVINKKTEEPCKLTILQEKVLYQRISFELHQELYDDRLEFILCEDENIIYDNFVELLEVSE